jgi:cadmium resistance protein CadD (predicted permease)
MKIGVVSIHFLVLLTLLFVLVTRVSASDGSAADQFLGSPLLILVSLIAIDIIAFMYHKLLRK